MEFRIVLTKEELFHLNDYVIGRLGYIGREDEVGEAFHLLAHAIMEKVDEVRRLDENNSD